MVSLDRQFRQLCRVPWFALVQRHVGSVPPEQVCMSSAILKGYDEVPRSITEFERYIILVYLECVGKWVTGRGTLYMRSS